MAWLSGDCVSRHIIIFTCNIEGSQYVCMCVYPVIYLEIEMRDKTLRVYAVPRGREIYKVRGKERTES